MESTTLRYTEPTPVRDGFGAALLDLGSTNRDVVALGADLTSSIRAHWFAEEFPERYIQMGISESDMVGTAAGLSFTGFIPFLTTFSVFATSLANQAVRLSVAYNGANVKIAVSHGGITVGPDGATHQAFEDIALMRAIPDMTVIAPSDANQAYDATIAAAEYRGPVFLRLARGKTAIVQSRKEPFAIGRSFVLRDGKDVAIIATGSGVELAVAAANRLEEDGIAATVVDVPTIKPLDSDTIVSVAEACGCVVTVEEHSIIGGLGGAVSELLAQRSPHPIEFVGVEDTFGESGEPEEILTKYGISVEAVTEKTRCALQRKK